MNAQGSIVATAAIASGTTAVTGYAEQTEFGLARSTTNQQNVAPVYGWLGEHQKAESNLSGLVLMGVRVYNPLTGSFTSMDPVLGGNDGPYVYPVDPLNQTDLLGLSKGQKERNFDLSPGEAEAVANKLAGKQYNEKLFRSANQKLRNLGKSDGDIHSKSRPGVRPNPGSSNNTARLAFEVVGGTIVVVGVVAIVVITAPADAIVAAGAGVVAGVVALSNCFVSAFSF